MQLMGNNINPRTEPMLKGLQQLLININLRNKERKKLSDCIPFDIQREIIKRLPVKPLIRFRIVSKPWKSFIDSSEFIKIYGTQRDSCSSILSYKEDLFNDEAKYICFYDINNDTPLFKDLVVSPLLKQCSINYVVGVCHGLLCLYGFHYGYDRRVVVISNPSIRKSFAIVCPGIGSFRYFSFGVCPVTKDPTVLRLSYSISGMLWQVDVFTLSSGVWNVIPLPRESVRLSNSTHVVIDRFIYWGASESIYVDDGMSTLNHMLVSFDLITKEFRVVDLPKSLTNELYGHFLVSVCKLRESLVVYGCVKVEEALCCAVWVMELDSSFTKLFTISARVDKIFGFRKSGEPIFKAWNEYDEEHTTLNVYNPSSKQIKNLGIVGLKHPFFMASYKESLLLLDHSDLQIYPDNN